MEYDINKILDNPFYESRYKSLLMVPIKDDSPYNTIISVLSFLEEGQTDLGEFKKWFLLNLSSDEKRLYNTFKTLERANLIRKTTKGTLALTLDGIDCMRMKKEEDKKILIAKNFAESYLGIIELICLCVNFPEYKIKSKKLFEDWYQSFESTFGTKRSIKSSQHQYSVIKRYLESLNLIKKERSFITPNVNIIEEVFSKLGS